MKIIKEISEKGKFEQAVLLIAVCIIGFAVLCLTGCGGSDGSGTLGFEKVNEDGIDAMGCSVPGLGGCCTPGHGCMGTACWAQSCKYSCATIDTKDNAKEDEKLDIVACDTRYYKGGCLGCGKEEKSCYIGCVSGMHDEMEVKGVYMGNNANEWAESFMGYANGCKGCVDTSNEWGAITYEIEKEEGIE